MVKSLPETCYESKHVVFADRVPLNRHVVVRLREGLIIPNSNKYPKDFFQAFMQFARLRCFAVNTH